MEKDKPASSLCSNVKGNTKPMGHVSVHIEVKYSGLHGDKLFLKVHDSTILTLIN